MTLHVPLQTYISALDEDLGKAQARMDIILGADNSSAAKQNELLKAAAKQVGSPCCISSPLPGEGRSLVH